MFPEPENLKFEQVQPPVHGLQSSAFHLFQAAHVPYPISSLSHRAVSIPFYQES